VFVRATSSVVGLSNHVYPSRVFRGVWAVVIDAIKSKPVLPRCNIVCIEHRERVSPPVAHNEASSAVVFVPSIVRVIASLFHRAVSPVKIVAGKAVGCIALGCLLSGPAAARNNPPATDVFTGYGMGVPAVADAVPHGSSLALCFPVRAQCDEPAETLTSDVDTEFLGGSGGHDISNPGKGTLALYHGADAPEYKNWMPSDDVYEGSQAIQFSGRLSIND
jgi:hypothetical protein